MITAADAKGHIEKNVYQVETVRGITYFEGDKQDSDRHQLDIYVPKGQKGFPVVFFVHGGGWTQGDKNHFGIYAMLGRSLARHGIGFVSINYRLSPKVKHPEHIKDVARAFDWTYRHISEFGGRPDEIFVCGHSAGGHLVALLASDERYLGKHQLSVRSIRGVIPISGVYRVFDSTTFGGAFDTDPLVHQDASPIHHARGGLPPFLLLFAESELPGCDQEIAAAFHRALDAAGTPVQIKEIKNRNHISIIVSAIRDQDPVNQAIRDFVWSNTMLHRLFCEGNTGIHLLINLIRPTSQ